MSHPSNFAQAAISDMDQLSKKPGKQIFKTVQNLLRGLDNRMQLSRSQIIDRPSYWEQQLQDGRKIQQMFGALVQTYGDGNLEMLILKNLQAMNDTLNEKLSSLKDVANSKSPPQIKSPTKIQEFAPQTPKRISPLPKQLQKSPDPIPEPSKIIWQSQAQAAPEFDPEQLLKMHYQHFYQLQIVPIQSELQKLQVMASRMQQENEEIPLKEAIQQMGAESDLIDQLQQEVKKMALKVGEVHDKMGCLDQMENLVRQNEIMKEQLAEMQMEIQQLKGKRQSDSVSK